MRTIVIISLMIIPFVALAQPVPDTGQTQSYTDTFGEDSDYLFNVPSYTKLDENGDDLPDTATEWVMVRDNITGLIWEVKTDDGSIHDMHDTYNLSDAQTIFINELNTNSFGGFNDWRMPTVKELSFIVDRPSFQPAINVNYFPNTLPAYYITLTIYAFEPWHNWRVHYEYGISHDQNIGAAHYVRAVRGNQFSNNFIDNGDGTITDLSTGLMWQQGGSMSMTWEDSLSYCEDLTLAGYYDWRLPNIHELHSIVDYTRYYPSIDTSYFANTVASNYWSSTTLAPNTSYAWDTDFYYGRVNYNFNKGSARYVRAIRSGDTSIDSDGDGYGDASDNCPDIPNAPALGTCIKGTIGGTCTDNIDCGTGGLCSKNQEDADNDQTGDACDNCTDTDGDGYGNPEYLPNTCDPDNCPDGANPNQEDVDSDAIGDVCDNCPNTPNASLLGTCLYGAVDETCTSNEECDVTGGDGFCSMNQEDTYPPSGNGIGDACECEADFDRDGDVDADDVTKFLEDFGRGQYYKPCP